MCIGVWAGNPGRREPEARWHTSHRAGMPHPLSHGKSHIAVHRPVLCKESFVNPQYGVFQCGVIRNHSSGEYAGSARNGDELGSEHAAGQRFSRRKRE